MYMSEDTVKNLELDFVLDNIIVYTPYGDTFKKSMRPFRIDEKDELIEELDRIEKIVGLMEMQRYNFVEIRNYFKHIKDLRLTFKRATEGETLSITELYEIKIFAGLLKKLNGCLDKLRWDIPEDLRIRPIPYLEKLLDPQGTGTSTFYIYDEYSDELLKIRKRIRDLEAKISIEKRKLREKVERDLNIKLRPNGEITVNKVDTDTIEKFRSHDLLVYTLETYMNITFKVKSGPEIDILVSELEELKGLEEEEEVKVREYLTGEIKKFIKDIEKNLKAIAKLDLLLAKAYHAVGFKGVRPEVSDENHIYILNGRHIKVERSLIKESRKFTPITVSLSKGVTCITGANMGGKTVSLKLIGLLSAMAQYGMFVPAEKMSFSLKEYIFFSMGDVQSIDMGLSTFGGEIMKIKEAIKDSDRKGLILIDELARGTNPKEGFAISKAIINYLKDKETITVITTHFDGLTDDKKVKHLQVRGLSYQDFKKISENLEGDTKIGIETLHHYMDYRLQEVHDVTEVPKDAINISRLMGLDEEILKDAERILSLDPKSNP